MTTGEHGMRLAGARDGTVAAPEPSGAYYDYTRTMQPERPWLLPYHQSLVYFIMLATRGGDGSMDNLFLAFEQALDAIRKVHNLTCGMPQIVYLIGWPHEGHDSKYCAKEQEVATQRKVYRYFRERGIDVTPEWVNGFRDDRFVGLQPWAWHGGAAIRDLPDALYCTDVMAEAREFRGDPAGPAYAAYLGQFCLKVLPWYCGNNPNGTGDTQAMTDGTDVCMPALWCAQPTLIACSQEGYEGRNGQLPDDWQGAHAVPLSRLTFDGPAPLQRVAVTQARLPLQLGWGEALRITPAT